MLSRRHHRDPPAPVHRRQGPQTHGLPANHPAIPPPGQANGLTLAEAVDRIAATSTPIRPPGTVFEYAPGVSYHIAGRIAEVVTGQPWETVWREQIGDPLAMTLSTFGATANPRIGGGLRVPLAEYANLVQMHLRGGTLVRGRQEVRVLSAAVVAEMQLDQLDPLPFVNDSPKPEVGYGLSWWFDEIDASGMVQGSVAGAFGAIPWIDTRLDYGGFLLVDSTVATVVPVWSEVVSLIEQQLE